MNNITRMLQNEELKILKYIKKMCEKNNIDFFIQYGTFLGAVRHKGFIPWDDDADICIKRKDLKRFIELIKNDNSDYEITTYEDEASGYNYVCKVHSKNIIVKEKNYKNDRTYGIWVDVFPLDGMPNNRFIRFFFKYRLLFHRAMWKLSNNGENIAIGGNRKSLLDKLIIFVGLKLKIGNLFKKEKEIKKINMILEKYDFDKSKNVFNFFGVYKDKEVFDKNIYMKTAQYKFEDVYLPGPADYDSYLKQLYNDYMKPPKSVDKDVHELEIYELKEEKTYEK